MSLSLSEKVLSSCSVFTPDVGLETTRGRPFVTVSVIVGAELFKIFWSSCSAFTSDGDLKVILCWSFVQVSTVIRSELFQISLSLSETWSSCAKILPETIPWLFEPPWSVVVKFVSFSVSFSSATSPGMSLKCPESDLLSLWSKWTHFLVMFCSVFVLTRSVRQRRKLIRLILRQSL